jgi:hypothetical protein
MMEKKWGRDEGITMTVIPGLRLPFRRVFMSEAGGLDARSPTIKYEAGGW